MQAPDSFKEQLKGISYDTGPQHQTYDYVQLFVQSAEEVNLLAPMALQTVKENGKLWLCYPKKSSGVKTGINRDAGWDVVVNAGFGGVASVSIDETWSAIRFRPENKIVRKGASVQRVAKVPGQERVLEVPEFLQLILDAHPQEKAFFDSLSYTHRKEYVEWIIDAKRPDTRQRRLQEMLERLKEGKKRS